MAKETNNKKNLAKQDSKHKDINKVVFTESEKENVCLLTEEFKSRGGMNTEELISRLKAVPFEEFMNTMKEKIQNYK